MHNPWEQIPLEAYEAHMGLDSVRQLQTLNEVMRGQLATPGVATVMILGVAGGNGLEHVPPGVRRVYGVDVNAMYLEEAARRHPQLEGVLECVQADLREDVDNLPRADLVVANLLVEYVGCARFQQAIRRIGPRLVTSVIQVDMPNGWVSDSPYRHTFDGLSSVHAAVQEKDLVASMREAGYHELAAAEHPLPNGKSLLRLDFARNGKGWARRPAPL